MNLIKSKIFLFTFFIFGIVSLIGCKETDTKAKAQFIKGNKVDSLNKVYVYYNGSMSNVSGRNTTDDGYNLGLKYQCVEFVKRYYFEHHNHKMPNSWGNAKDFFKKGLSDGALNPDRNLKQYTNPSQTKPKIGDLVVYDGSTFNSYGHVAIISKVSKNEIEVIQQNVGKRTRATYSLNKQNGNWEIGQYRILGWLSLN